MAKAEFRGGPCGGHFHILDGAEQDVVGPCAEFDGLDAPDATYRLVGSWVDDASPGERSGPIYAWVDPTQVDPAAETPAEPPWTNWPEPDEG